MKKEFGDKLKEAIHSKWDGYTVTNFKKNGDNSYRAEVNKPSGSTREDIAVYFANKNDKIAAYVVNYAEGGESICINLSSGDSIDMETLVSMGLDTETIEKNRENKVKDFLEKYPKSRKKTKENPLLSKKNLTMFGTAFNVDSPTWGHILNPICVPFYANYEDQQNDKPCGAQIIGLDKDGKSVKRSVTKSTLSGAFHVLQFGEDSYISSNKRRLHL